MKSFDNVFLIGPMGAGKSTVGRRLAELLDFRFVDSDREIEARTGVDIPLIFELEGEEGFRRREAAMIEELTEATGIVLATGGGAILRPENRTRLRSRGTVVYLQTSVDEQLQRTRFDKRRPLLQTEDPRARLEELMAARAPLYEEAADIVVRTDSEHSAQQVARELMKRLGKEDNEHAG